jgi:zinc transport system ATP-binding protein
MKHERTQSACGLCCTRIEGLTVSLEGHEALRDVNLHIHCGELTAVIGPNGAGKTTLLRALLGLVPYAGKVLYESAEGGSARPPRMGYVPQSMELDRLAPLTVEDLFAAALGKRPAFLGAGKQAREQAVKALEAIDAHGLVKRRLGALSGGELQRVLLALALTPAPDVLLLDEPVSGVDALGLERFYATVDRVRSMYDLTCILVSHDLGAVRRHADRVALIRTRVLDVGTPEDVFSGQPFQETFGFGERRG